MKEEDNKASVAVSQHVMQWPEYLAFMERLGVDLTRITSRMVIDLQWDCEVRISHEFAGSDTEPTEP